MCRRWGCIEMFVRGCTSFKEVGCPVTGSVVRAWDDVLLGASHAGCIAQMSLEKGSNELRQSAHVPERISHCLRHGKS